MSDFTCEEVPGGEETPEKWIDPTDPAVARFEKALWELAGALKDLGVDTVQGPKDCYLAFGDETFARLRHELIARPTCFSYFRRAKRKKVDPDIMRWMHSGIQFGDVHSIGAAIAGEPFFPVQPRCNPPAVRFAAGCPSRRRG